jgi:carbamoyl-phosphate synthase large subunit
MKKVLVAGAGGAPSEGVINSLLRCDKKDEIIGMSSDITDLALSNAQRKYHVPYANTPEYKGSLLNILKKELPDLIHFQNDSEIYHVSKFRGEINALGVKMFMPDDDVIDTCVHKHKTFLKFKEAGLKVPRNIAINNEEDLKLAFAELADEKGSLWLRAASIGGGGNGALPTNNFNFAKSWIEHYNGWGNFLAAELLTPNTVTWLSIWHEGELVVAQTRVRKGWVHGNRTLSGVTGVTKVGQTYSNEEVNEVAIRAVKAVSEKPHGIFGVDMAYDKTGVPNPTEINIARFFTTILFFTEAGLNMPKIFKDIAIHGEFPNLAKKINPLPDGLMWLRGMDTVPQLTTSAEIEKDIIFPQ